MRKIYSLSFIVGLLVAGCGGPEPGSDVVSLEKGWKIHQGDDIAWADPSFDDRNWERIDPHTYWEKQLTSFEDYDGYAWYRIRFTLNEDLLKKSYFGKEIQVSLGYVDDTEQTFLNGELLGQNNILRPMAAGAGGTDNSSDIAAGGSRKTEGGNFLRAERGTFERDSMAYSYFRNYVIPVDDPRLRWGEPNVLAVRVHDHGGNGGINHPSPSISIVDIKDFVSIDITADPFLIKGDHFIKTIRLKNTHPEVEFEGQLRVKVTDNENQEVIYNRKDHLILGAETSLEHSFTFGAPRDRSHKIEYIYEIEGSHYPVYAWQGAPYLLTPPEEDTPAIHGPDIFGVRPGNPFLYTIPASGIRPITFSADTLPEGLTLDSLTGLISGSVRMKGEFPVMLMAENSLGMDRKAFTIRVGDTIQLTPPMGWNSWNCWGLSVNDAKVRSSAEAMVSSGLINYGWNYMNIDDGWEAAERTRSGELLANEKFPDMKALADYVHELGLKIGIYSSPGPLTCGGFQGSYQHERQDARTWSDWGMDYLKYDWCSYRDIMPDESNIEGLKSPYRNMREALDRLDRDIVYSLCQYGMGDVSSWGASVGGNLWRTTYDITDTWESLVNIGFSQHQHSKYARPGGYNDPDMMILGWVGWGPNLHPTRLTADEQYTHVSLWCLLSAPLLLGNDLSRLDDFTLNLLTNDEVLEVNQDRLCDQADKVFDKDSIQVWLKEMWDGSHVAGFFNMDEETQEITMSLGDIGLAGRYRARDLWRQEDVASEASEVTMSVFPHGVRLYRLWEE